MRCLLFLIRRDSVKIQKGAIGTGFAYGINVTQMAKNVIVDSVKIDSIQIGVRFAQGCNGEIRRSLIQTCSKIGIEVYDADVVIKENMLYRNQTGILIHRQYTSLNTTNFVLKNTFYKNSTGLRLSIARDFLIKGNVFNRNSRVGLSLNARYSDKTRVVQYNNFLENQLHLSYNDGNKRDLLAINNWWNETDADSIAEKLWDQNDDPEKNKGRIVYIPFLQEPVDTAGANSQWIITEEP